MTGAGTDIAGAEGAASRYGNCYTFTSRYANLKTEVHVFSARTRRQHAKLNVRLPVMEMSFVLRRDKGNAINSNTQLKKNSITVSQSASVTSHKHYEPQLSVQQH